MEGAIESTPGVGLTKDPLASGGVQSVQRALDLIEIVAERGGQLPIGEIASLAGLAIPTAHRLLRTLVARGYMRQLANRHYALGARLVPMAQAASTVLGADTEPILATLVARLGETANLAVLSGLRAQYVAQVSSPHQMRMFTEVGRQVQLHCTGVGKALLSQLGSPDVRRIVRRAGLAAQTSHTITAEGNLLEEISQVRLRGFALDEQEQELGVRCVAVPVPGALPSRMAVSVSGPLMRVTDDFIAEAVPLLIQAAQEISHRVALP